jgi:hypothetical protein
LQAERVGEFGHSGEFDADGAMVAARHVGADEGAFQSRAE